MLTSAHIATGVLLFSLVYALGLGPVLALFALIGALLPDFDYVFDKMHRTQITHSPAFWFLVLTPFALTYTEFAFLEIGVAVHFILDTIDWGVMWLHPKNSKLYGGLLRKKNVKDKHISHYLSHNGFVALELLLLVAASAVSYLILL